MTIRNLQFAAHPRSLAVFGASERPGSVGEVVLANILQAGFEGPVWPVNPKHRKVHGLRCFPSAARLPEAPDLAVIATPPAAVPGIIDDLCQKGCRAAVVITAGLTEANGLRRAMLDAARPHLFRIMGPNTLGLIIPPARLNASFAHLMPEEGNVALLSQSGAIATSLIDWAGENNVGFSHVVSMGDMADVDVGDWLDLLAGDARTRTIVMYLETITNPRKFMSAARAASRIKPVIAVKAGRSEVAARAAATHTGALSGSDDVVEAALRRAGVLRVDGLSELFDAVEVTARFRPLRSARTAIVTNGGGAGVLATDRLEGASAALAELSAGTVAALDGRMPANWSRANPVDIIGDAPPERFAMAVEAVAGDPGVDALMVLNCPTGLASAEDAARAVAGLATDGRVNDKPVIACWLGETTARAGRRLLQDAGIPTFETPAAAAGAASCLASWSKAQQALERVPASRSEDAVSNTEAIRAIFESVAREQRRMLSEPEAKAVLAACSIPVPETAVAATAREVEALAAPMLAEGGSMVVKLLSKTVTHKSDVGGVVLDISTAEEAAQAARAIEARLRKARPDADLAGFVIQPMVRRRNAHELILGMSRDPIFGPVVLFGAGGTAVEVLRDTAVALPPLDAVLAGDMVEATRIGRLLAGYRDRPPANREAIVQSLNSLSQLIVDFPCIEALDINPLLADPDGVIALDARIEIDPVRVGQPAPNPDLVIRPYPQQWVGHVDVAGKPHLMRPIKPSDIDLYPDFLSRIDAEDIRLRFLAPRRHFPHEMLTRLTQLDYDRDIAFVVIDQESEKLEAVSRLSSDPDRLSAEFALLVRSDLQGQGLGRSLLSRLIDYARSEGIAAIEGHILEDNAPMLAMCRAIGFEIIRMPDEPGTVLARLDL